MAKTKEIAGKRYRITTDKGYDYVFVAPNDIMYTVAEENSYAQQEFRAMVECICRLASKGMNARITLADVAEQLYKAGKGRSNILVQISEKINGFCDESRR